MIFFSKYNFNSKYSFLIFRSLSIILILSTFLMSNGKQAVVGKVVDNTTNEALSDVTVLISGTNFGALTGKNGLFRIENVPSGTYIISASRLDYILSEKAIEVSINTSTKVSFSLTVSPISIEAVTVERDLLIGNPQNAIRIPGVAHYIGKAELETHGYNDIHRILHNIPGVNLQEEDGFGLRPNIGIRGSGSERSQKITLMEDGILIAPAPYAAPAAYYFPTVGRMSGIELRKGSSQIKYGPFTTGGALNLISSAIPEKSSIYLRMMGGEDFTRSVHTRIGGQSEYFGALFETYQAGSDGFKRLDSGENTGFVKSDYLGKFRINTSKNAKNYQELQLKLAYTTENSDETYLGLTRSDFEIFPYRRYAGSQVDNMDTKHELLNLRHFIKMGKHVDLTTTFYNINFKRNWYKLDKVNDSANGQTNISSVLDNPITYSNAYNVVTGNADVETAALFVKANNREYLSRGIQSTLGSTFSTGSMNHLFELGMRIHRDEMDRFQWIDEYAIQNAQMSLFSAGTPGTESNRIESADVFSGFLQYQLNMKNLSITPGIRHESFTISREDFGKNDPLRTGVDFSERSNNVSAWIPGIGMVYEINNNLRSFVGLHKGFAPPGSSEGTDAESSVNYEFGWEYRNNYFTVNTALFVNEYANLLGSDLNAAGGTGTGDMFNGGEASVKGLELSAKYDLAQLSNYRLSIPLRFSYTYTNAQFKSSFDSDFEPWGNVSSGDNLPYVAPHSASGSIGMLKGKFAINVNVSFVSQTRTVAGSGNIDDNFSTDQRTILDYSIEYFATRNGVVFLTINNLLDTTYVAALRPAGLRPGLPRTVQMGFRIEI